MMQCSSMLALCLTISLSWMVVAQVTSPNQAAAAMLWPPDRRWGAAVDNTEPCGSAQSVWNRTDFPLTNGRIAMAMQDDAYNVTISISYLANPTANNDFEEVLNPERDSELTEFDPGHQCFDVPDAPSGTVAGQSATIQLNYISDFDNDGNKTFYACSDVTYVAVQSFNATRLSGVCFDTDFDPGDPLVHPSITASPTTLPSAEQSDKKSGLSGGAIAGIVVGVVVGGGALLIGAFLLYRRRGQRMRRDEAVNVRMNELTSPTKRLDESGSERQV
ncbi:hypothetical protein EJ05DRAFT_535477 [Pseudovirgaria hyperparasitica]|uniref:Copper acquisition factor BIM1-like domain-containing protein n=1 Tax=Pseudovirgaria hyperparasitica TaxID=470096 RepID=A0A6A6WJ90_9PEZI|nr:uncharacterized protein EJ05DRAFT_535477 [Pseudovirgaria hyperparasitica]KAF2762226.1 hypothetical protein EJ05DRAFT_535477 [Pseudovirgaria hyperparasitica]